MSASHLEHLTLDEIELWAQGLLPAGRDVHLAVCDACRARGDEERRLFRELAQVPRFGPEFGFLERVMAKVKVQTPSGRFKV